MGLKVGEEAALSTGMAETFGLKETKLGNDVIYSTRSKV